MPNKELTPEQQEKIKDQRKAAVLENGVKARIARRTLRAENKLNKAENKEEAKKQAEKAIQRETLAINLWDADGDGDIDELDRQIIESYFQNTQSWVDSGESTWLRHVEMSENPEVYMETQGGTVQVNGEDVQLDSSNEQAVAAFVKLHQDQADIWRAALDAAEEEIEELKPLLNPENGEVDVEAIVEKDKAMNQESGLVVRQKKPKAPKEKPNKR